MVPAREQRPANAIPLLEHAIRLARDGDSHLSTRHWTAAVLAQARAAAGDFAGCEAALETAEHVRRLNHPHNGGWLRFDGARLAEDRAACYVRQRRSDLAEPILTALLRDHQSGRRRGITLVDLATVGAIRRDPLRVVTHATAALDHARHTGSGVVVRKLRDLRPHLNSMRADPHICRLQEGIAELTVASA